MRDRCIRRLVHWLMEPIWAPANTQAVEDNNGSTCMPDFSIEFAALESVVFSVVMNQSCAGCDSQQELSLITENCPHKNTSVSGLSLCFVAKRWCKLYLPWSNVTLKVQRCGFSLPEYYTHGSWIKERGIFMCSALSSGFWIKGGIFMCSALVSVHGLENELFSCVARLFRRAGDFASSHLRAASCEKKKIIIIIIGKRIGPAFS